MNRACRSPRLAARPAATRTTPCCSAQRMVVFIRRLSYIGALTAPVVRAADSWRPLGPLVADVAEVRLVEAAVVLQAVTERAIHPDVREPDERHRLPQLAG